MTLDKTSIDVGSGSFLIKGGPGREHKKIEVFYHMPKNFSSESKVLLVIPGAGRNGDSYRDAWIEEAEKYSVLILSPKYKKEDYGFDAYHFGGLIQNLMMEKSLGYVAGTNHFSLNEDHIQFDLVQDENQWIFKDFDRIFDQVVQKVGSNQSQYDIFGHSAGGQILHRMALFYPKSKANRIIAANSGFYTLPDLETPLLFGTQDMNILKEDFRSIFNQKLVLYLGELDNASETGGTLLRSISADKQGLHRLARGNYFYKYSKQLAKQLGFPFNWELIIIPEVGHDHRGMGNAAGKYLYE